jgi:hypothetical protein
MVRAFVLLLTAIGAGSLATSCVRVADLEKADKALTALLSRLPIAAQLPASVQIKTPEFARHFSGPDEVKALNEVLGSSLLSGSDAAVRQHGGSRAEVGKVTISADGVTADYALLRAAADQTLWCISLPDRSHWSSSILFFRDDGRFSNLLRSGVPR